MKRYLYKIQNQLYYIKNSNYDFLAKQIYKQKEDQVIHFKIVLY